MAVGTPVGRRLLHEVLVLHLVAWGLTFVLSGRNEGALIFQVPLWVIVPVWLVREIDRGRAPARWLFALLLTFLAAGNLVSFASWTQVPEHQGHDPVKLAASALLATGYSVGAAVVVSSPAISRAMVAARAARNQHRTSSPADPNAASDGGT